MFNVSRFQSRSTPCSPPSNTNPYQAKGNPARPPANSEPKDMNEAQRHRSPLTTTTTTTTTGRQRKKAYRDANPSGGKESVVITNDPYKHAIQGRRRHTATAHPGGVVDGVDGLDGVDHPSMAAKGLGGGEGGGGVADVADGCYHINVCVSLLLEPCVSTTDVCRRTPITPTIQTG